MSMVSHLYPVNPIGIGTPGVESLTGYVTRLAGEHLLQPHYLIRAMRRLRPGLQAGFQDPKFFATDARRIDGTCASGRKLADVLADLTGQHEVRSLTLSRWADILDPKQKALFKSIRAWCPECHVARTIRGESPYEPMLWKMAGIKHCHVHRTRLRTTCPNCGEGQPMLPQYGWLVICLLCEAYLGAAGEDCRDVNAVEEGERSLLKSIGRLLMRHNAKEVPPTRKGFVLRVTHAWNRHCKRERRVSEELGKAVRDNMYRWRHRRHRPTLKAVLRFAGFTNVDVVWLLDGHGRMDGHCEPNEDERIDLTAPFSLHDGFSETMR